MARRPTIKDIAKAAGVGPATVDRVLNGRGNVSERVRDAVAEAAHQVGYRASGLQRLPDQHDAPPLDLGFVLHKRNQPFYQRFTKEIEAACAAYHARPLRPHFRYSPSQAPSDFAREIEPLAAQCQAIAASAVNHASLSRLSEQLMAGGTPVFSLLNDFGGSQGAGYFGMDNLRVGRLAAWMLATRLQRPCRAAVFVGGARWHGQALREAGFRAGLREHRPEIEVVATSVNLETRQVTYEATLDLLQRHDDFAGLYVAGGGMEGAIAALREARPPGKVALVVNELTPESRAALSDGYVLMVISTPLPELCRKLVARMAEAAGKAQPGTPVAHSPPTSLDPQIYLPESF